MLVSLSPPLQTTLCAAARSLREWMSRFVSTSAPLAVHTKTVERTVPIARLKCIFVVMKVGCSWLIGRRLLCVIVRQKQVRREDSEEKI
jgi:hypothetical protein